MHINITTEWMMVGITTIYVVATILILIANRKSVRVAQEQLEEMRREFKENNRPVLEIEVDLRQRVMYVLKFVNRGSKTAYHVKINLDKKFIKSVDNFTGSHLIVEQIGKECIIGAGQHYDLFLFDVKQKNNETLLPVSGIIEYEANGERYNTDFNVDLKKYMTFFSNETDEEKLRKLIDKQNEEIGKLNKNLSKCIEACRSGKKENQGRPQRNKRLPLRRNI